MADPVLKTADVCTRVEQVRADRVREGMEMPRAEVMVARRLPSRTGELCAWRLRVVWSD
jgi:hypothetical protein